MVLASGYARLERAWCKENCAKGNEGTKPGDVILFHDGGGNRTQTIQALEEILPALKSKATHLLQYPS